jgi:hypothetical protein
VILHASQWIAVGNCTWALRLTGAATRQRDLVLGCGRAGLLSSPRLCEVYGPLIIGRSLILLASCSSGNKPSLHNPEQIAAKPTEPQSL